MHKVGIFSLILSLSFFLGQLHAQTGKLKMLGTSHYFGSIKEEGGKVGHNFRFVNTGSAPLKISSVKSSCGCTVPVSPDSALAPGDTSGILVVFNPENRPGSFRKKIYYSTNGSPRSGSLTISGRVRPRPKGPRDYYPFLEGNIRMKTNHFVLGKIYDSSTKSATNILYNKGEKAISFDLVNSQIPDFMDIRISKDKLDPGDTLKLWMTYHADLRKDWGYLYDAVYLKTDDPERPMKALSVSAHIREKIKGSQGGYANLVLDKSTLHFGEVETGTLPMQTVSLKNTGKAPLLIRRVYSKCSCLEFQFDDTPIPPGEKRDLTVTFNTRGRMGLEQKEFVLITNSKNLPERHLPTQVKVISEK